MTIKNGYNALWGSNLADDILKRRMFLRRLGAGIAMSIAAPNVLAATTTNCFLKREDSDFPYLLIDPHCHIFNSADVAVFKAAYGEIMSKKMVPELAGLLSLAAKTVAYERSVKGELAALAKQLNIKNNPSLEMQQIRACNARFKMPSSEGSGDQQKAYFEGYSRYRIDNLVHLMNTFPQVDLFTPSMVDLYLGTGPARANIVALQPLYTRLAILSAGRMHPFASFDPFRQTEFVWASRNGSNKGAWSPLEVVKTAIRSQGFVGVKLYPPMGYSPDGGNENLACGNKRANYNYGRIHDDSKLRAKYGTLINEALNDLYQWCSDEDVPILAHTNDSMQVNKKCVPAGQNSPEDWAKVAANFRKMRMNLGHFGGVLDKKFAPTAWALGQAKDMKENLDMNRGSNPANGSMIFADVANYSGILDPGNRGKIATAFSDLYRQFPVLNSQLMYGSDWFMLEDPDKFGSVHEYPSLYQKVVPEIAKQQFFGGNATEYLGLKVGRGNRERLNAFYKAHGMDTPAWVEKLV